MSAAAQWQDYVEPKTKGGKDEEWEDAEGTARPDFSQNPPSGVTKPHIKMHYDPGGAEPEGMPGVSEGAGLAEGLSDYDKASFGQMGSGISDVAHGQIAKGGHKIMSGFGAATVPALALGAPAMLAAPAATGLTLGGGYLGGKVARGVTEAAGGSLDQADFAGDVGNLVGGAAGLKGPKVIGSMMDSMGIKSPPIMQRAAQKLVAPMVYENVGETARDRTLGAVPERGIVNEGHVGTKTQLVGKMDTRIGELKNAANQILDNHPNSRQLINAEPIVDSVIDSAVNEAQKGGESPARLEALRTALKTKYGKMQGTPREMNDLKTDIQDQAMNRGAYKNTQPQEASVSRALGQVASRLRAAVDEKVPEAAQINQRIQDQIDARSGIQKNIDKARGEDIFKETASNTSGPFGKIAQRTLGSAPVRTGLARMLNFGHTQGVPEVAPYQGPQIAGLLPAKPSPLGPSTATGPLSAPPSTVLENPAVGHTRAERLGLMLPEHATPGPTPMGPSTMTNPYSPAPAYDVGTAPVRKGLLLPERAGSPHNLAPTMMGGAEGFPGYGPEGPHYARPMQTERPYQQESAQEFERRGASRSAEEDVKTDMANHARQVIHDPNSTYEQRVQALKELQDATVGPANAENIGARAQAGLSRKMSLKRPEVETPTETRKGEKEFSPEERLAERKRQAARARGK